MIYAAVFEDLLARLAIGVSQGLIIGLLALGIVLIYKGSRILNLAHPYAGLVVAFVCWWLTSKASFAPFSWLPFALDTKPRFLLCAVIALALGVLNGYAIEHGVIRRLKGQPRLVVLVATIALAQGSVGLVLLLFSRNEEQATVLRRFPTLFTGGIRLGNSTFTGSDMISLVIVPILCLALAAFFRYTRFGVAVRASAENVDAARLLGIPAARVSSFVWMAGAFLAGLAGILVTQVNGSLDIGTLSTGFLVRGLAAALVGGLTSLPGAIVGGLYVGVSESVLKYATNDQPGVPETLLFLSIVAILLLRPGGLFGRPEATEDKVAFVPTVRGLPARLRGTLSDRGVRAISMSAALFVIPLSLATGAFVNGVLIDIAAYSIVGVSLVVLMGFAGQVSLGHWGLVGVGAFATANLVTRVGVPYLLAIPAAALIAALVSLVIGLPALRIRGLYLAVVTLAFNLAAESYLFQSRLVGGSTAGVQINPPKLGPFDIDSPTRRPLFALTFLLLLACLWIARNIGRSRTGRSFAALRENEKAAATLGVDLTRAKLQAFALSGAMAGLAGAMFVSASRIAEPTTWTTARSLVLVAMVMIGGLGSLTGAVLGAFIVFGLPQLLDFANDWVVSLGTGALLLTVIVRLRGGLAGLTQVARQRVVERLDELDEPASERPAVPVA
ncbi:MAG TPA: ABC transporter permease [Acidimicrobiales bacterium]|nr:ABC transporter permease [Acidimicrobiales bacterium]